jgi:hypothetical protein
MIHLLFATTLTLAVAQEPTPPNGAKDPPPPAEQTQDQAKETPPEHLRPVPQGDATKDPKEADAKEGDAEEPKAPDLESPAPDADAKKPDDGMLVEQNYREAMRTYQSVFSQEANMDLKNVRTRITANEKLLSDYGGRLSDSESRLRALRTSFDKKVMAARQGQKEGRIPQDAFDRMLNEQKDLKSSQEKELEGDIAFYRQEMAGLRSKLTELRSRNRLLSFDADLSGGKKAVRAAPSLQDEIVAKFQKLNRFEMRPIPLPYQDEKGGCSECRDCVLGNKR